MRKKLNRFLVFLAVLAVFGVSFFMGRNTAVRNNRQQLSSALDEAERAAAVLPLLRAADPIEIPASADEDPVVHMAAPDEEVEPEEEEPPFPLPKPVDGSVSNSYSLQAVYSETMHDWRAHMGIDIDAALTAAITVPAEGTVIAAYEDTLWGKVIEIRHKGGLKTVYKGVSTLDMVKAGETVPAGKIISGVGTSPIESKAMSHLHFEIWQDDVCINPESYIIE